MYWIYEKIIPKLFSPFFHGIKASFYLLISSVFYLCYCTMSIDSIESTVLPPYSASTNPSKGNGTNSEPHFIQTTTIRLNDDNFLQWSQSIRMYMRRRRKMGYLIGDKIALQKMIWHMQLGMLKIPWSWHG